MAKGKGKAKAHAKVEVPPHLRLGLNFDAFTKFVFEELSKVGFKSEKNTGHVQNIKEFRSEKCPESLFWIAEQYGDRPTGYDLAEATKMWLRMNNAEDKSVCEVLKERGWVGVGEAEVFLSHVQAESPEKTMEAMVDIDCRRGPARRGTKDYFSKVWVDYFCLRQLRSDFQPEQIEELIRETGAVWVHIDGEETGCSYPTRSFCVLEFSSAVKGKATLMIMPPSNGPLAFPFYGACACCTCECLRLDYMGRTMPDYSIDAAAATARRAEDKAKVDKFIEEGPGFARVNHVMQRELRHTARQYAWNKAISCWCCCCVLMGCVEAGYYSGQLPPAPGGIFTEHV